MNKAQMKFSQAQDITRKALGIAIVKNRGKIIALLKKYGVAVDNSYSNEELIVGTLAAVQSKERFREDLKNLLTETTSQALSFTGEEGMNFFYADGPTIYDIFDDNTSSAATTQPSSTAGTTTAQKQKTALGSLLSDKDTLKNILGTGLNVLSTSLTSKSNQKLADKALAIETEKTKQAALSYGGGGAQPTAKNGWSTGAIIGVTLLGIVVLGGTIYLATRNSGKTAKAAKS
jgi:hypothetical protein